MATPSKGKCDICGADFWYGGTAPSPMICAPCNACAIDWDRGSDEWKAVEFHDTLEIVDIHRGRSAANFVAVSEDHKRKYTIFIKDFLDMFRAGISTGGKMTGDWIVRKRGNNYGVRLNGVKATPCDVDYWSTGRPIPEYV